MLRGEVHSDAENQMKDVKNADCEASKVNAVLQSQTMIAHAPPLLPVSSTPMGIPIDTSNKRGLEPEDVWCGPWSTAADLVANRHKVKMAREDAIACGNATLVVELDEYDLIVLELEKNFQLQTIKQQQIHIASNSSPAVLTLTNICLKVILNYFEYVQDLGNLSDELRQHILNELASSGRLTRSAVRVLVRCGHISIMNCSKLDQDVLIAVIHEAKNQAAENFTVLKLLNCGHAFTTSTTKMLAECSDKLTDLTLSGCYLISEQDIKEIVDRSPALQILDLSFFSQTITERGMSAICKLSNLHTLCLDYSSVDDQALLELSSSLPSQLTDLSLCALLISDLGFSSLFSVSHETRPSAARVDLGSQLIRLSIRECALLTNKSILTIKAKCRCLHFLDISRLNNISQDGLLALFLQNQHEIYPARIGPLQSLFLEGNVSSVSDRVILAICESGYHLSTVSIAGCNMITGKSLVALEKYYYIEFLNMSFLRQISIAVFIYFVTKSRRLKEVQVWGCTQLSGLNKILPREDYSKIVGLCVVNKK